MDLVAGPAAATAVEETDEPVGVGVAMTQEAAEVVGDPRYPPAGEARKVRCAERFDLTAQLFAHTLVGVETQYPVVAGALHCKLLLRPITGPVAFDHACAQPRGQLTCGVRGVRVHDNDLVAEAYGLQTRLDPIGFVVGDDAGRQPAPDSSRAVLTYMLRSFRILPMSATLFFDPVCQQPYDTRTLLQQAMGGTEATVTRVADALEALVVQHNRTEAYGRYRPPQKTPEITSVVINRDSRALSRVRDLYPNARVYLWLHDQLRPGSKRAGWLASTADLMREMAVTIVCVSDTQRRGVEAALRTMRIGDLRTQTIYNPIDDALVPDGSPVETGKLVFFSSPNKGLKFTLDAFRAMRRKMPDLRLVVGTPATRSANRSSSTVSSISGRSRTPVCLRKCGRPYVHSFRTLSSLRLSASCSRSRTPLARRY